MITGIYVIHPDDNVGVATMDLKSGKSVQMTGVSMGNVINVHDDVKTGHKVAVKNIPSGMPIIKYGVVIGVATQEIHEGDWVHLHNMMSRFDERSSKIDPISGAVKDTIYE